MPIRAQPADSITISPTPTPAPSSSPAVKLRGHIVAESAANPTGGFQQGTAFASEIMAGADVNIGKLANDGLGLFHLTLTAREGSSLSANAIGNIFTVQEIYGSGLTPRLTEASFEQSFAKGHVNLELGRVITENDFGASPTYWGGNLYCSYQSNAICGTPIAVPINAGYDAYPQSVWGARIRIAPTPNWYLTIGGYQVDPAYGERGNGFNLGFGGTTGTFLPIETGIIATNSDHEATGSLRAGAFYDTSSARTVESEVTRFAFATSTLPAVLPAAIIRGRYGYWVQADHLIAGRNAPGARGTAIFAAYNFGDPQTALLKDFLDAGVVQRGTFPGRSLDTVAIGYAYGNINPNLRAFETSLNASGYDVPVNGQEQIGELNYGVQVEPWLSIRPGLQYVWRPSGDAAIRNALVIDLSTAISF